ncbi:Ima1 N-terminal domain-containing protein [Auriculariales sp. MPI-PUGE-AT-0066]|nr:Ima1 N-terminal domain-containing protein [Auriculariales sp. MPI-PUGE-AT-0066]
MFARKSAAPNCYYCLSPQHTTPRDPRAFHCDACGTWNRYSQTGEINGHEPAMYDETLNHSNFAKRGSPSTTNLPSSFAQSVFCRTCQTNQTLLINLLSNYLPEPKDPDYNSLLEQFPAYKTSLEQRYPPVCRACQASVDEELQKRNQMARSAVLGGRLRETRKIQTERITRQSQPRDVWLWRVRGTLWVLTELGTIILLTLGMTERLDMTRLPHPAAFIVFILLSISWTFWDPTWSIVRRATVEGERIRVLGRSTHIKYQSGAWINRWLVSSLVTADFHDLLYFSSPTRWLCIALIIDLVCLVMSFASLSVQRPTAIRLLDTKAKAGELAQPEATLPPTAESDPGPLISTLSLDPQPVMPKPADPVFGETSFPQASTSRAQDDEMDWMPTNPTNAEDDGSWLRPQMFFAPDKPTGLEFLFEKATLQEPSATVTATTTNASAPTRARRRWWILAAIALAYGIQNRIRHNRRTRAIVGLDGS